MATFNISTYAQLQDMENHKTDDCVLLNDIDASASRTANEIAGKPDTYNGFAPINLFAGTFDGQNFKISNLYINRAGEYIGLFGKAQKNPDSYYIKDVTLENCNIKGANLTGALCGYVSNYAITNCHSSGTIEAGAGTATSDKGVGGLIGMYDGEKTVSDCSSSCTVQALTDLSYLTAIGGFAGQIQNDAQFTNCTAAGLVKAECDGGNQILCAGGFVGRPGGGGTCNLDGCIATGDVTIDVATTGTGIYIGGFVGDAITASSDYETCFAYGDVSYISATATNAYVGGFAGTISHACDQCGAEGDVENASTDATANWSGGFVGKYVGSDLTNCYAKGKVCEDGIGHDDAMIGGFLGEASTATRTITNCYSSGAVQTLNTGGTAATNGGGFAGVTDGDTVYTACFYDNEASGWTTTEGDAAGTSTALMKTEATFTDASWDFDAVWQLPTYTRAPGSGVTVWLSEVGDYEDFDEDVKDADAFSLTLASTNNILWIEALEALIAGTGADEWKIGSNELDTPITPTNFTVRQQANYGSKAMQALKINEVILFVNFVGRKLREMTYSEESGKYVAPDLTALAEHITSSGITSMALQKNPDTILWITLDDGSLISMTYDREQDVIAWSKHPMQTDALVQSVAVIPQLTEDEVWLSVKRTMADVNSGTFVIYIERMQPRDFGTDIDDAFFVDSGITFTPQLLTVDATPTPAAWSVGATITGASSETTAQIIKVLTATTYEIAYLTGDFTLGEELSDGTNSIDCNGTHPTVADTSSIAIGGLLHLIGETVKVLGDGVEYTPTAVVDANGAITIGTTVEKAQAGLPFTYKLQPMRPDVSGQGGTSHGSKVHVPEMVISFLNTVAARYGVSDSALKDIDFDYADWVSSSSITGLFTGDVVVAVDGGFSIDVPLIISDDGPMPCTVRALVPRLDITGR